MSYGRLLNKMILDKGYNYKEFLEECEKRGIKKDKGNFSKIINDKVNPPKEEISRIFAQICNADERLLILEGYIDTAPKEIKEFLVTLKRDTVLINSKSFDENLSKEKIEELMDSIEKEPLANIILEVIDKPINDVNIDEIGMNIININNDMVKMNFKNIFSIEAKDDAMFPQIQNGAKIVFKVENEYKNGDILVVKLNGSEDYIIRYGFINDNKITLMPLNKKIDTKTYKLNNVTIIGKVIKVITEL